MSTVDNFARQWHNLEHDVKTNVSLFAKVLSVKAYLADAATYNLWRKRLGPGWRKEMVLPSFDASLEIDDLGRLEVQVEPGLKAVEKGWLSMTWWSMQSIRRPVVAIRYWLHISCVRSSAPSVVMRSTGGLSES